MKMPQLDCRSQWRVPLCCRKLSAKNSRSIQQDRMRTLLRTGRETAGDFDPAMILIRILLTLVCGSLLVVGWRMLAHDKQPMRTALGRLSRRGLLNVEDAVRWRPEF